MNFDNSLLMSKSMKVDKKRNYSDYKSNNGPLLNPLQLFPSKSDTISSTFFSISSNSDINSSSTTINKSEFKIDLSRYDTRWLDPQKIDMNFGIAGESQIDLMRRNYRRIESSDLFLPKNKDNADISLSKLSRKEIKHKKFILVEEDRLEELKKLESVLREEKKLLGEQCTWILPDMQFNARIPIPATRLALHNLCEDQMKRARAEIIALNEKWITFVKQNHYDKKHLYLKDSYLKSAPTSQRALKLRLVREAAATWILRKDRDTMLYEDNLSYLTNMYQDAAVRKRDYDRYYILASRYGYFSEKDFNFDSRPGRRYFVRATMGALKFQHLWDRYWAVTKLRRYKAARMIQKYARRMIIYKKLHPIIRMRLKIGKKTYYMFCFPRWKEYSRLSKFLRIKIYYHKYKYVRMCFLEWKKFKENKKRLLKRFSAFSSSIFSKFHRWKTFSDHIKVVKLRVRRLFQNPHFDMWVKYVEWRKHVKGLNKSATVIQRLVKTRLQRKQFLYMKKCQRKLRDFSLIIAAKKYCNGIRNRVIDEEYNEWLPDEMERRNMRLNEAERMRLVRRQNLLQEKEKTAISELKQHLNSSDGKLQVIDQMTELYENKNNEFHSVHNNKKSTFAYQFILDKCSAVTRQINIHDFNVRTPPFITCPDPRCGGIFTTEEQYINHVKSSNKHTDMKFAEFHIMLRHVKGQEQLKRYLSKLYGITEYVNCLDAWVALQEWKRFQTTKKDFLNKAMNIYEMFIIEDAPRNLDLKYEELNLVRKKLLSIKRRDFEGYFQHATTKLSRTRKLFGFSAKAYEKWTDDIILSPAIFIELEWQCFVKIFKNTESDSNFKISNEYNLYSKARENDLQLRNEDLLNDYRNYRNKAIMDWTRDFLSKEQEMIDRAEDIVMKFIDFEADNILTEMSIKQVKRRMLQVSYKEQSKYEENSLIIDDIVCWAEENVLEFIFTFYVDRFLKKMWELPEFQKGMLEYSGISKTKLKKKLPKVNFSNTSSSTSKRNEDAAFLDGFVKETSELDHFSNAVPIIHDRSRSAIIIQCRARGMLGRNGVRKIFVKVYTKKIDPSSGAYYYTNVKTHETSWERPKFMKYLFPNSLW